MSIRVTKCVLDHFPEGGSRKLALLCLADYCDDSGGTCYPSIATLARRMCCSEQQARRHVHGLIKDGYVSVEPGTEHGGGRLSRHYRIAIQRLSTTTRDSPTTDDSPTMDGSRGLSPVIVEGYHPWEPIRHRTINEPSIIDALFAEFWKAYPKKVGKPNALKAFRRIKPDRGYLDAMLVAITRQSASTQWQQASGQYIPHPSTWLNDERWKDASITELQPRRVAI